MKISVQAAEVPVPCEVLRCSAAVPSEFGFRGARGWGHQGWSSSCFFLPPKANSANTSLNSLSDSTTFNNMPRTRCWRWWWWWWGQHKFGSCQGWHGVSLRVLDVAVQPSAPRPRVLHLGSARFLLPSTVGKSQGSYSIWGGGDPDYSERKK